MIRIPLLAEEDFEYFRVSTQVNSLGSSAVNDLFADVAQETAELPQTAYPIQVDGSNLAKAIAIRAIAPEYRQMIAAEPLTKRELEVLQLIVDGHSNDGIAQNLYISSGTVKNHIRNVLKKLCANGRTQAAIRALRSGLAH
jgi:DNA-binding NarL/FixJ family response regulator